MNFVPEIVRDDRVSEGLVRDFLYPSPRGNYWFSGGYWLIGEGVMDGNYYIKQLVLKVAIYYKDTEPVLIKCLSLHRNINNLNLSLVIRLWS